MDDGGLLYYAVMDDNVEKLAELLDSGANVDEFYEDSMNISSKSLLHICCGKGRTECVKVLIDHGAQLDVRDKWGQTPLMYSVSIQFPEVAKVLLDADAELVKGQDRFGKAPLHCAVEAGSEELVNLLLEYGADVNIRCHDGMTPLMMCCTADPEGAKVAPMKALMEAGAMIGLTDYRGRRTALHIAVVSGNVNAVETLITAGADVNGIDKTQRTPLTLAIFSGVQGPEVKPQFMRIITLLISAGARLDICDSESCSPLMSSALLKSEPMVRYFLNLGANPNLRFPSGVTAALVAASTGDMNTLKTLIHFNCNLTIKGNVYKRRRRVEYFIDPFELAYIEGNLDLCVLMVESGYRIHGKGDIFRADTKMPSGTSAATTSSATASSASNTITITYAQRLPDKYESILHWLIDKAHEPRSLTEESVFTIRKALGQRLVKGVETLPLPQRVKNSILLTDLLT